MPDVKIFLKQSLPNYSFNLINFQCLQNTLYPEEGTINT